MGGGMTSRRGVPLRDRPVAQPMADRAPRTQGRHCWVTGPPEDPGPWPGLIIEWRKDQAAGWSALVVYVIPGEPSATTTQTWLPRTRLRPA